MSFWEKASFLAGKATGKAVKFAAQKLDEADALNERVAALPVDQLEWLAQRGTPAERAAASAQLKELRAKDQKDGPKR